MFKKRIPLLGIALVLVLAITFFSTGPSADSVQLSHPVVSAEARSLTVAQRDLNSASEVTLPTVASEPVVNVEEVSIPEVITTEEAPRVYNGALFIYDESQSLYGSYWVSLADLLKAHPNIRPIIVDTAMNNIHNWSVGAAQTLAAYGVKDGLVAVSVPGGPHDGFEQQIQLVNTAGWKVAAASSRVYSYVGVNAQIDKAFYVSEYGTWTWPFSRPSFLEEDAIWYAHVDNPQCYAMEKLVCGSRNIIYVPLNPTAR